MSFADYWEDVILDHVFGVAAYTAPANIYVALSTADPLDDGSGLAEPSSADAYARAQTAPADWNAASGGGLDNLNDIVFPEATGSWGTMTHFALFDEATPAAWVASTAYSEGDWAEPTTPNGYAYECTVAGTSDAAEPTWPTTPGDTVVDGTVTWTCRAYAGNLLASGTLDSSKSIESGDTAKFAAGDLDVTLD